MYMVQSSLLDCPSPASLGMLATAWSRVINQTCSDPTTHVEPAPAVRRTRAGELHYLASRETPGMNGLFNPASLFWCVLQEKWHQCLPKILEECTNLCSLDGQNPSFFLCFSLGPYFVSIISHIHFVSLLKCSQSLNCRKILARRYEDKWRLLVFWFQWEKAQCLGQLCTKSCSCQVARQLGLRVCAFEVSSSLDISAHLKIRYHNLLFERYVPNWAGLSRYLQEIAPSEVRQVTWKGWIWVLWPQSQRTVTFALYLLQEKTKHHTHVEHLEGKWSRISLALQPKKGVSGRICF